ncbi:MAG: right-handed parallel beta-helix repeat-containing protein [Acidobacteria bacterium]|nr:right-handed parallel beta-helix repeat-containing protein [Acidobacteriota bacterium]
MPKLRVRSRVIALVMMFSLLSANAVMADDFIVNATSDAGPGSLRQAMLDANASGCSVIAPCRIVFAIPGPVPPQGWFTIAPKSPLPIVTRAFVEIDGSTQSRFTRDTNPFGPEIELDGSAAGYRSGIKVQAPAFAVRGLAIHSFEGHGIYLDAASGARVEQNYIGVDPTAMVARPNGMNGIAGRGASGWIAANIISGNQGNGIYLTWPSAMNIYANRIGLGCVGELPIPNLASGVHAAGFGTRVDYNEIAFNRLHGVGTDGGDVAIRGNRIYGNGLLAIDAAFDGVDAPASGRPVPPVLTSVRANSDQEGYYTGFYVAIGHLNAGPHETVSVDLFASPYPNEYGRGDGRIYLGSTVVTTDADGSASFEIGRDYSGGTLLEIIGGVASATLTTSRTTSELSAPVPIALDVPAFEVTSTADDGPGSLRAAIAAANDAECAESPCRITFRIAADARKNGVATIALASPLPPITNYIRILGASQSWWEGDTNVFGPEVEIADSAGLQIGLPEAGVERAYVSDVVVSGARGDGITVYAASEGSRIELERCYVGTDVTGTVARPNGGNGIRFVGGKPVDSFLRHAGVIRGCVIGGNGANGVLVDRATGVLVRDSRIGTGPTGLPLGNRGAGVRVAGSSNTRIEDDVIAFNDGDGVETTPDSTSTMVRASIFENGGLGIDVNDDGVSPAAGGALDPPVLTEARWDEQTRRTLISGTKRANGYPANPPGGSFAGNAWGIHWYRNDRPDPSGSGEAQEPLSSYYPPFQIVRDTGTEFTVSFELDLRGSFISATTNRFYCFWEFGCTAEETSELSRTIEVR